jgi:hypothetical protein
LASTYKTSHLGLNNWIGTDKPKREDFTGDNALIDSAVAAVNTELDEHSAALESAASHASDSAKHLTSAQRTAITNATTHAADSAKHLTSTQSSAISSATTHAANSNVHVTAAQKTAWSALGNSPQYSGQYTGNNSDQVDINMGFLPRFALVFAIGKPPFDIKFEWEQAYTYCGFVAQGPSGQSYGTLGIQLLNTTAVKGISILGMNVVGKIGMFDTANMLNYTGETYKVLGWK